MRLIPSQSQRAVKAGYFYVVEYRAKPGSYHWKLGPEWQEWRLWTNNCFFQSTGDAQVRVDWINKHYPGKDLRIRDLRKLKIKYYVRITDKKPVINLSRIKPRFRIRGS